MMKKARESEINECRIQLKSNRGKGRDIRERETDATFYDEKISLWRVYDIINARKSFKEKLFYTVRECLWTQMIHRVYT